MNIDNNLIVLFILIFIAVLCIIAIVEIENLKSRLEVERKIRKFREARKKVETKDINKEIFDVAYVTREFDKWNHESMNFHFIKRKDK